MMMETRTEAFEPSEKYGTDIVSLKNDKKKKGLEIEGYKIEGLSIGGHETCIIIPTLKLAFDIGRCPWHAISQDFLFISHAHMDHIGGLPMYAKIRELYSMKPPTIIVPRAIKEHVQKLFEVHRAMDQSELKHNLIGLDVGEKFCLRKDLKGYVVYSVRQKIKPEYIGLSGNEIKDLKLSGVEITYTMTSPEIAVMGDTMSDFIIDHTNVDVLGAKILIMEIVNYADRFENKAILLIHFSACYQPDKIQETVSALPPPLAGRGFSFTEGF